MILKLFFLYSKSVSKNIFPVNHYKLKLFEILELSLTRQIQTLDNSGVAEVLLNCEAGIESFCDSLCMLS